MKHLKTKLMASAAMLMVATVMISSASFAWFTISTAPEVSGVSTKTAANGNLEIALINDGTTGFTDAGPSESTNQDTGKNTTWGNLIDVSTYFSTTNASATLRPAAMKADNTGLQYAKFGDDGRVKELADLTKAYDAVAATATGNFTDGYITYFKDGNNASYAYQFDYYVRTNTAGDVLLQKEAGIDRGAGETGLGCKVDGGDANVKVAIKSGDATTYAAAAYTEVYDGTAFDDSVKVIANATPETVYRVSVLLYWDAATLTNADMKEAKDVKLNVQFKHSATLTDMEIDGDDSTGRLTPAV